jgi:hypothetical protein
VALFHFLSRHADVGQLDVDTATGLQLPSLIHHVRDNIPHRLASLPGKAVHAALQGLVVAYAGTAQGDWLQSFLQGHASAEAARRGVILAAELPHIGEVYCREPRTEGELYKHVMARLHEIQEGMEGGPFSDRGLFAPGIDEKMLQLWLAARLSDTPLRRFIPRFRVHRESEVDEGKKPDIEVSSAAGKICIEVKPVDATRSYSANNLTDTLRTQLVGQYLRGQNSHHGVLVLFRLDQKQWEIPGKPAYGDFQALVAYLTEQARIIAADNIEIEGLSVIGMDCVSTQVPR